MKKILALLVAALFLTACSQTPKTENQEAGEAPQAEAAWKVITLDVDGMTCEGCENAIKAGVESLAGIESVESSFEEGWTKVKYDENRSSQEEIEAKIAETGYTVVTPGSES
ncbi:MAG: cation transporter [Bacteroidales bacterium]